MKKIEIEKLKERMAKFHISFAFSKSSFLHILRERLNDRDWNFIDHGMVFVGESAYGYNIDDAYGTLFTKYLFGNDKESISALVELTEIEINEIKKRHQEDIEQRAIPKVYYKSPGYIYVIESQGLHKIGKTKDIANRIKKYITENPHEIKLVSKFNVSDYTEAEKILLDAFKGKKVMGEWFNLGKEDVKSIKSLLKKYSI